MNHTGILSPFWAVFLPFLLACMVTFVISLLAAKRVKVHRSNRAGIAIGVVLYIILYPILGFFFSYYLPDLSGNTGAGDSAVDLLTIGLVVLPLAFLLEIGGAVIIAGVVNLLAEPEPLTLRTAGLKFWNGARWVLLAVVLFYAAIVAYGYWHITNQDKTAAAVAKIHANHLVWADINGTLPAQPDSTANNATLAGVDANNNSIRDDVEIAIYNAHKNNWKVATAELQYAKELQMEFTQVFNSDTLVAVLQEEDRGFQCIESDAGPKEVENLVYNTDARKSYEESILEKYMTSYILPNSDFCDIDPATLPN